VVVSFNVVRVIISCPFGTSKEHLEYIYITQAKGCDAMAMAMGVLKEACNEVVGVGCGVGMGGVEDC
jgi:hypothetical protein